MKLAKRIQLWLSGFRYTRNARLFLYGTFLMGLGQGSLWIYMNLYFQGLGFGEATIGRILSANSLGAVLISVPAAIWIDRFSAQAVFLLAAAGFGLVFFLQLVLPSPTLIIALSLATGMFFTVHWVVAAPFIVRNSKPEERTELFGKVFALETVATIVSAYGVGFLIRQLGFYLGSELAGLRYSLIGSAVIASLAVIPFSKIRSAPIVPERKGWRAYFAARDFKLIGMLCFPGFLIGCGAGLTIPFLNLYFRNRFGQDPDRIGGYFAISQVLTAAGFLLGPVLARRFNHVKVIVATELLSIPFFLILAVSDRLWLAVLAFWMRGALMNMNQPVSSAFAMEVIPPDQQASTNSLRMLAWNSSWMISTPVGGWLIERHGFAPNMLCTMGLYLVASTTFFLFFRRFTSGQVLSSPTRKELAVPSSVSAPTP